MNKIIPYSLLFLSVIMSEENVQFSRLNSNFVVFNQQPYKYTGRQVEMLTSHTEGN